MSIITTVRSGNAFLPYQSATKRTKQVNLTVTSSQTGWSTAAGYATGVAYADSSDNWRLAFNINANYDSATVSSVSASISGVVFKNASDGYSAISGWLGALAQYRAYVTPNSNVVTVDGTSASYVGFHASGDVALESKPTWADANMEGVLAADVYIPSASAGIAGLIDNTSGNTVGNPIKGRTDGSGASAGYVGEILEQVISATQNYSADGVWLSIASVNLTPGVWELDAQVFSQSAGATMTGISCGITSTANSATGINFYDNGAQSLPPNNVISVAQKVSGFIVNTTSSPNITYYLNVVAYYSAGQPIVNGRIRAQRRL